MPTDFTTLRGLSIDRLRSFCLIIEKGSVVVAAERDPARQSQFSRQIRDLEQALGARLFVREGRRLKATPAGIRLAALTKTYFSLLRELKEDVGEKKPINLGLGESITRWFLMPRMKEVLAAANAPLNIENCGTEEILNRLDYAKLDVGILWANAVEPSSAMLPFLPVDYILMVPRNLLGCGGRIEPKTLLPVAMLGGDAPFLDASAHVAKDNHFSLQVRARLQSFSLVASAAKVLKIAAFVPSPARVEFPGDQFVAAELRGLSQLTRLLAITYNRKTAEMNEGVRQFSHNLSDLFSTRTSKRGVTSGVKR
jgi:DNA-binding transcriptional LysR family regulator